MVGILAAGLRQNLVKDSICWSRVTLRIDTERGSIVRDVPFARHTARMTSVSTPSSASVQEALTRMSLLRDNDFTAKAVRDMIAEVEGWKPRKKKPKPQTTIVYNTVYNSGAASSATISSGTPVRRDLDATNDGRGLVKNLSGRLARKPQRSASLVNAGLSKTNSNGAGCGDR